MFVEGAKNGNYRSVSIAHSLRGAFFFGGAAPAVAGAGSQLPNLPLPLLAGIEDCSLIQLQELTENLVGDGAW